jgi:methylated-DNA-protein-cysteine methyltransferase related protein
MAADPESPPPAAIALGEIPVNDPVKADRRTYERIYDTVRQIPYGKVATYGQIAELSELPRQARLVGYALFRVDVASDVPWHRVINAKGEISVSPFRQGGDDLQRVLLEEEGVIFSAKGRVDLRKYRWC